MANPLEQAKDLILKSDKIAVIPGYDPQGDAFASGLALFYTLRKLDKKTNWLAKDTPKRLEFLKEDSGVKEAVLTINSRGKEFRQMRYEKNHEDLKIYFTLARGEISPSDISIASLSTNSADGLSKAEMKPDLLITIGVQNMEALAPTANNFSSLYEIPLLNIDNQLTNEQFGNLNLVDHSVVSLSEIIADLVLMLNPELLDNRISTILLTGLILATHNFQHPRTSPKTLSKAAQLLERGADHEKIIKHLHKTKTITYMHLLGRILQNMRILPEKEIALTTLTKQDFEETTTSSRDLAQVLEDIKLNFPQLPSLVLLWESHRSEPLVKGIISCKNSVMVNKILDNFEGVSRNNTVLFLIREHSLKNAEERLLDIV